METFTNPGDNKGSFWENLIPENLRKAEETQMDQVLLPRRRNKVDEIPPDTSRGGKGSGKGKQANKTQKKKQKKKGSGVALDKKDFRAFLRSWKKFGELSRIDEILEDAGLSQKDPQGVLDIAEGVSMLFSYCSSYFH